MFGRFLLQLIATMIFTALGQQVHGAPAGFNDPVCTARIIDKPKHFNTFKKTFFDSPFIKRRDCLFFALGYPGRSNFNTINAQLLQ